MGLSLNANPDCSMLCVCVGVLMYMWSCMCVCTCVCTSVCVSVHASVSGCWDGCVAWVVFCAGNISLADKYKNQFLIAG